MRDLLSISFFTYLGFLAANLFSTIGSAGPERHKNPENDSPHYQYIWTSLTSNADFSKAYNFQLFSANDRVWAFHHEGVWWSTDGKEWRKTELTNILKNQGFL